MSTTAASAQSSQQLHMLLAQQRLWLLQSNPDKLTLGVVRERSRVLHWMCDLCEQLQLAVDTLSLAAAILDAVITRSVVNTKYVECVGLCALYMAVKLCEEVDQQPFVDELLAGTRYSRAELLRMERAVLIKLDWQLHLPNILQALHLLVCVSGCSHLVQPYVNTDIRLLLRLALTDHNLAFGFACSTLALGILAVVCERRLNKNTPWLSVVASLQQACQVPLNELIEVRERLCQLRDGCGQENRMPLAQLAADDNENIPVDPRPTTACGTRKRQRRRSIYSESNSQRRRSSPANKLHDHNTNITDHDIGRALRMLYGS